MMSSRRLTTALRRRGKNGDKISHELIRVELRRSLKSFYFFALLLVRQPNPAIVRSKKYLWPTQCPYRELMLGDANK